jgi:hypothetical protein
MVRSLRLGLALVVLGALALASVSSAAAGGPKLLDARLTGIPTGGLVLQGVTGGGVPWKIDEGRAKLFADGRLEVEVDGLVIAATGVNPIGSGRAIVTCNDAVAARSGAVPFSPTGDAEVETVVDLPSPCLAPAVFFAGIFGANDLWFAVTGG